MKRYFLVLMLAIMCIFVLAVSASATEYTIESNSEYQEAFENAVNGDTIVINSALTCDILATKSITYVLKANWQSSKMVIASNVEVSFIADGGDYKIMPTAYSTETGWLNIADEYENVVINLGGMNGGTLTIDGTNATHDRVSYVTATAPEITLNLLDGSAIANFNPETRDSDGKAYIIYARNINMYSGSKIYANRIGGAPLLRSTYFNLFGGEIFGNLLESKRTIGISTTSAGAIFVYEGIMVYGGRIYENIFNAKNTTQNNQIGFFTTMGGKNTVVLDLEIGDTYVTGNGPTEISAMFGTLGSNPNFYYNSGMKKGTRYIFTGTPELKYDETTGKTIWKVSKSELLSSDWTGKSWVHKEYGGSIVAAFIKAEKKSIAGNNFDSYTVIDARIEGKYPYTVSVIEMPKGYALWSTDGNGYCHTGKAYTLEEVKASSSAVFYSAYNAERITIDGTASCPDCGMVYTCNNPEHDLHVSISYSKYTEPGKKVFKCNTCNLEKASEGIADPLFECRGYSAPEDGSGGIAIGFTVNYAAIKEYKEVTGKDVKYGVFAVLQDRLGDNDIFASDGTAAEGVISVEITSYEFTVFEIKIIGFTDNQKDTKLAMGAYVAVTDGESTEYSYMQGKDPSVSEKYSFVSYNDIVPTTSSEDDEVTQ